MLLIASLVEFAHCLNADMANAQYPLGEFRRDQFAVTVTVTTAQAEVQVVFDQATPQSNDCARGFRKTLKNQHSRGLT